MVDPFVVGSESERRKRAGQKMGVYDHLMRQSMGHRMQVELRKSMEHYHGNKSHLQQQLAELCFDNRDLYTSPHASPTPSISSIKRWQNPDSKFNMAPDKAAHKARLAQEQQGSVGSSNQVQHFEFLNKNNLLPPIQTPGAEVQNKNALVPPPPVQIRGEDRTEHDPTHADNDKKKQREDHSEKKALRFGANVELKTPIAKKTPRSCSKKRTKSALKDKTRTFQKLPTLHSAGKKRMMWDSGHNHVHHTGTGADVEISRVKADWQNFSCRSVNLPPIVDSRRMEIHLPSIPKGLTKAKLQAAQRLQKKAPSVKVTTWSTAEEERDNIPGRSSTIEEEDNFRIAPPDNSKLLPELDDSNTLFTASEDEEEVGRTSDQLELPPLPVVRLTESKVGRHNLQPSTRRVPRLRLDRVTSPGLMSTGTGRSGATGATGATYMSLETLEWKGEYMTCASRNRKHRMLEEIVQIVHQRMRDNEEDLKMAGHNSPSQNGDDDVKFWDRLVSTPGSGATTGRSIGRRQRLRAKPSGAAGGQRHKTTGKKQIAAAAGTAPSTTHSSGAKLHTYLQKLSQQRKAAERQRHQRDRVHFHMTNMTSIREITQSSIGRRSSAMHTSAPITPLVA